MENNSIEDLVNLAMSKVQDDEQYAYNIIRDLVLTYCSDLDREGILPNLSIDEKKDNLRANIQSLATFVSPGKIDENSDLYKCLSCIFGAFYGDELGSFCEFKLAWSDNYKRILTTKPVCGCNFGQITDDSEMAMALSFGIMESPSKFSLDSNFNYYFYGLWKYSQPYDIGQTISEALKYFGINFNPAKDAFQWIEQYIKECNKDSLSNGFLMRLSPFIVWFFYRNKDIVRETFEKYDDNKILELYDLIYKECSKDCKCTHPNQETFDVATIFSILTLGAICGLKPSSIIDVLEKMLENKIFDDEPIKKKIKEMISKNLTEFKKEDFDPWNYFTRTESIYNQMGYYKHAFSLVLFYLFRFESSYSRIRNITIYRYIMEEICNLGGDTDTNAAIVGTVIGPILGFYNFGKDFWNLLTFNEEKRWVYSPSLMIYFVNYLLLSSDKDYKNNHEFLKMIITLLYFDISKYI